MVIRNYAWTRQLEIQIATELIDWQFLIVEISILYFRFTIFELRSEKKTILHANPSKIPETPFLGCTEILYPKLLQK